MNPNCFGTGSNNVAGCNCKVIFDNINKLPLAK